jgi:hypothetical protein|tara:strand:+ start:1303 stop:1518 length:216 start_codon:yes stop_codon:yes gene_type:complete
LGSKTWRRFVISYLVIDELLPDRIRDLTGLWVEDVGGAAVRSTYLDMIESAGLVNVEIADERPVVNGTEKW